MIANPVHPLLGVALVLCGLGLLLAVVRACQRRWGLHPEVTRKIVHVLMGLAVVGFPFLFDSVWPVAVLAGASVALLYGVRTVSALKGAFGGVVDGVQRESWGELYFPAAVCLVFWMSDGTPVLFAIPMLVLTFADATAALIGMRYGSVHYSTPDGVKSVEGSIAFFTVAFLGTHVPLLLFTDTGRLETLIIGVIMGIVIMLIEAISWRGLDNLFIPVFAYLVLRRYIEEDAAVLLFRLAVIVALSIAVLAWRKRTTFDPSGLIAVALICYLTWTLGGWPWLVAPLTAFFTYTLLWPRTPENSAPFHNAHVVLAVTAPGVVWLFMASRYGGPEWMYFGTLAYAVQLALAGSVQTRYAFERGSSRRHPLYSGAISWTVMFVPFVLLSADRDTALLLSAVAFPVLVLSIAWFLILKRSYGRLMHDSGRWMVQGAIGMAATLAVLPAWHAWMVNG